MECGYTLKERFIFNPVDEIFLHLSFYFPIDFVILGVFVLYIFFASLFGIVGLGIRVLCLTMYQVRARKSMPQALLVLCNVTANVLLALCMAMLTIAPNYTSFGSQTVSNDEGVSSWCKLSESRSTCQPSVISTFFARIDKSMPFFSIAYFCANWAFIAVFCAVFANCLIWQRRAPYLDTVQEVEEEEMGLLKYNEF